MKLAQCESGGNWHDNTGNGYEGGLQLLPDAASRGKVWRETPAEQIARAYAIWQRQGWAAWPVCSRVVGLR